MLTVDITYHAETRLMEVTSVSTGMTGKAIATTGDDLTTRLQFTFDDPNHALEDFSVRSEFRINVVDEDGHAYNPYIPLDENGYVVLPRSILSNVKCSKLPMQLAFTKVISEDEKLEFYSLNTLELGINRAIDATAESPVERYPQVDDAIYDVNYDSSSSTFTFTQIDGTHITIHLTDLAEDHFEVATKNDLVTLSQAERGDTATALDTGVWYKLYGAYDDLTKWYAMSGNATINGEQTGTPVFYAPNDSGTVNQIIKSNGVNNAPTWVTSCNVFIFPVVAGTDKQINHGLGTNHVDCTFYDSNDNQIEPAYKIDNTKVTISMNTSETIRMIATALPVWSVTQ